MRQQWLVFLPMTLATAGLAACASAIGGDEIKVRPVDNMQTLTLAPRDTLYESAVTAINERDYGRALDYLQAAKAKDPHNVKALNALGVIYDDPAPTFEEAVIAQNTAAAQGKTPDLQKLLSQGQTWMVDKQPHEI